jgi:mevalonate kinase
MSVVGGGGGGCIIFIFGPTEMCNTSERSSEKSSFNFEIISEVFFLTK